MDFFVEVFEKSLARATEIYERELAKYQARQKEDSTPKL